MAWQWKLPSQTKASFLANSFWNPTWAFHCYVAGNIPICSSLINTLATSSPWPKSTLCFHPKRTAEFHSPSGLTDWIYVTASKNKSSHWRRTSPWKLTQWEEEKQKTKQGQLVCKLTLHSVNEAGWVGVFEWVFLCRNWKDESFFPSSLLYNTFNNFPFGFCRHLSMPSIFPLSLINLLQLLRSLGPSGISLWMWLSSISGLAFSGLLCLCCSVKVLLWWRTLRLCFFFLSFSFHHLPACNIISWNWYLLKVHLFPFHIRCILGISRAGWWTVGMNCKVSSAIGRVYEMRLRKCEWEKETCCHGEKWKCFFLLSHD